MTNMYMCTPMYVQVCVCVNMHGMDRQQPLTSFLRHLSPSFLRQDLSCGLG